MTRFLNFLIMVFLIGMAPFSKASACGEDSVDLTIDWKFSLNYIQKSPVSKFYTLRQRDEAGTPVVLRMTMTPRDITSKDWNQLLTSNTEPVLVDLDYFLFPSTQPIPAPEPGSPEEATLFAMKRAGSAKIWMDLTSDNPGLHIESQTLDFTDFRNFNRKYSRYSIENLGANLTSTARADRAKVLWEDRALETTPPAFKIFIPAVVKPIVKKQSRTDEVERSGFKCQRITYVDRYTGCFRTECTEIWLKWKEAVTTSWDVKGREVKQQQFGALKGAPKSRDCITLEDEGMVKRELCVSVAPVDIQNFVAACPVD